MNPKIHVKPLKLHGFVAKHGRYYCPYVRYPDGSVERGACGRESEAEAKHVMRTMVRLAKLTGKYKHSKHIRYDDDNNASGMYACVGR
jgi:hypothetical protein